MELMRQRGIENVMALRGDLVENAPPADQREYNYARQLIDELVAFGGFCIGGACYPEGHPESPSQQEDLRRLKEKVEAGCQFLTTQMFFDNDIFYNFLYKVRDMGVTVPIIPGIMPMTNVKQVKRTMQLSGGNLPREFRYILDRFGDNPAAFAQAGIAYATQQIIDLYANGIQAIHVYSMNNPAVARQIQANVSEIIK
jgi:methylenetetrahydrofolate reductase (NADPH)